MPGDKVQNLAEQAVDKPDGGDEGGEEGVGCHVGW